MFRHYLKGGREFNFSAFRGVLNSRAIALGTLRAKLVLQDCEQDFIDLVLWQEEQELSALRELTKMDEDLSAVEREWIDAQIRHLDPHYHLINDAIVVIRWHRIVIHWTNEVIAELEDIVSWNEEVSDQDVILDLEEFSNIARLPRRKTKRQGL